MTPRTLALTTCALVGACQPYTGAQETTDVSTSSGAASTSDEASSEAAPTTTPTTTDAPATGDTTDGAATTDPTGDPGSSSSSGEPPEPVQGLRAEYFATYIDPVLTRVDPGVDFVWGAEAPDPALAIDRFSIRWTGALIAPTTGTYQLIVESDDGVRVWLDGAPVIDDWNGHFVTRNEATVELQAGVAVPLRIDYFELDLDASMRLLWSSDTLPEQVVPAANLIAAEESGDLQPPKPPFGNPVVSFDCPDPGVLGVEEADGPHFYMVCTGGPFPIRHSRDLVLWNDTGAVVLPNGKPAWAANGGRNWAPELHRVGEQYIAYFTTVNGADVLSIGAATASDPLGPYTESPGPLVEHPLGVIDANYFADAGKHYLIYKIDGNSKGQPTPVLLRELRADGLGFVDGSQEVKLLSNDGNTWEGGVVEATWLVQRDAFYYLFYSGNVYDHRYRTGVARSPSVFGPYEKLGAPILGNNERWVGPGHGTVLQVGELDYFVYHAWTNAGNGTQNGAMGRQVLVDRIDWQDGWPHIHDGTPSRSAQNWPGVP